jgi:asparagine synthase (glutamine-hydrolysing)
MLLDRKDRISMALGLEVRVPYCDHRLVEYLFNIPWSLKTFDGREKSLLRSAVGDLLPDDITWRVKSPFPIMRDPRYLLLLREQVLELLSSRSSILFEMFDRGRIRSVLTSSGDNIPPALAFTFEWLLNFSMWLDIRRPRLNIDYSG